MTTNGHDPLTGQVTKLEAGPSDRYIIPDGGDGTLAVTGEAPDAMARFIHRQFVGMVSSPEYPCVMSIRMIRRSSFRHSVYCGEIADVGSTLNLARDLRYFASEADMIAEFSTFVATFRGPNPVNENHFDSLLWRQLQQLVVQDGSPWDPDVSHDPNDPTFSFSYAGRAFFVEGFHAGSSRLDRTFAFPTLIFNLHSNFERLRKVGRFSQIQDRIRERELAIQGTVNPSLESFGNVSDALAYSGAALRSEWICPFRVTQ